MKARGNSWIWILAISTVGAVVMAGTAVRKLDLPIWESKGTHTSYYPGGGLWPTNALPIGAVAYIKQKTTDPHDTKVEPTEYVVLQGADIHPIQSLANPEADDVLPAIEKDLLASFFGSKPIEYLIDPQGLITEQKTNDVLRFIELHVSEARFSIYPIVLGQHQTIPESVDLNRLQKEWFGDSPAVLFAYYVKDPESLQIIYPQAVIDTIPGPVLKKIRESCVSEAMLSDNGPDQLEKITIELSIQTFWLEKLMDRPTVTSDIAVEVVQPRLSVIPAPISPEKIEVVIVDRIEPIPNSDLVHWIVIGSSCVLLISGVLFLKLGISQRRSIVRKSVLFPSYHKQERLGGEFSGGAFVGISFDPAQSSNRIG